MTPAPTRQPIPTIIVDSVILEPDGTWTPCRESVWRALGRSLGVLVWLFPEEAGRTAALMGVVGACLYFAHDAKPQDRKRDA